MKKEKSTETSQEREARLKRFHALTDEENEANIAQDPDSDTPRDPALWRKGRLVAPDGSITVPLTLDANTARFFDEHRLSFAGVLKAFVSAQEGRHE